MLAPAHKAGSPAAESGRHDFLRQPDPRILAPMNPEDLHPELRKFLAEGRVALDVDLYMAEGGPGLEAYIRDLLIMAWRQGYAAGRSDVRARVLSAMNQPD
ncbi:MAG: hypothetical protein GAK30_01358 [Paracidovorax wautersii]|uniref:Uncharacterized protein n=1 Tax=Paracidovorax wautersii TaxID=1177982 RepID=A0A7V8FQ67_9BURK|nr:MAG: hypothetical protein GAK30_01358 [Paracidovorax wautersii]